MLKRLLTLLIISLGFVVLTPNAHSQISWFPRVFAGVPSGSCSSSDLGIDSTTGKLYGCNAGSWVATGSGTVTSLTATSPITITPSPTTTTGVIACATCSTLTNGAGNTNIPRSDGTNLITGSLTDNGTGSITGPSGSNTVISSGAARLLQLNAPTGQAVQIMINNTNQLQIGATQVFTGSGTIGLCVNSDSCMWRGAAQVFDFGNGTGQDTSGKLKTAQTLQVSGANFTTSSATLVTVTGLSFTTPAQFASNWSFDCHGVYSQATAAVANLFGIITTGTAPTQLQVWGEVFTSNVGVQVDNNALITTATSTTVITATASAFGAIGTNANMFNFHIHGTVEAPSNISPTIFAIGVATGNVSDALTIYRGSSCWVY